MLKSFHHFSNMCQGHLFPPSQPSLHVELKISEFLANVTPTQWLSWEQPTSLSLRKRSDALNSHTGRGTESYKLCSQEQPAPKSPPSISAVWHGLKRRRNFHSKGFTEKILVTFSYGSAKPREVTPTFEHVISFSLLLQGRLLYVWFNTFFANQFQAMPKKGLTNDCRFQCTVSLLEYASALFFINFLLLSVDVGLRNTGAGNRNCDTLISLLRSLAPCGESLYPVCEFFIFLQILYLNPQQPKRIHQTVDLCCQMQAVLWLASWISLTYPCVSRS